jgi:hypothetical protein
MPALCQNDLPVYAICFATCFESPVEQPGKPGEQQNAHQILQLHFKGMKCAKSAYRAYLTGVCHRGKTYGTIRQIILAIRNAVKSYLRKNRKVL